MPIANTQGTAWTGYLVRGYEGTREDFVEKLQVRLEEQELPKANVQTASVNMWYRPDSLCLDVGSDLDGNSFCTIHVMDYGSQLFVGVSHSAEVTNYYKQMAAACLLRSVLDCLLDVFEEVGADAADGINVSHLSS